MAAEPARLPVTTRRGPTPPKHLSPESRRFFRSVASEYHLESHHLALLERACESLDRLRDAQKAIAEHGVMVAGRFGPRLNPAAALERDSRLAFARLLRELGLDLETPRNSERTTAARAARWR